MIPYTHILLLNIITIGLDTNYNNLQGFSPLCNAIVNNILLIIIPDKKSNMGKKRKLDREIKITVSMEKLLNISKRKLKKAKREKHLIHKTVLIQNTIKLLKHIEVEHEILNHSPVKKTKCDKYDIVNFYHPFDTKPSKDMFADLDLDFLNRKTFSYLLTRA